MWWTYVLIALSAFSGGWLMPRRFRCQICFRELPPIHQDGRCGDGLPVRSIDHTRLDDDGRSGDWAAHVATALAIGGTL